MTRPVSARYGATGLTDPLAALVERANSGDEAATRRILEGVAAPLLAVARSILGAHHPDVADAAQESLLALVAALPSFRGECTVVHFVRRIGVRTALRTRKRAPGRHEPRGDDPSSSLEEIPDGGGASPDESLVASRRRSAIRALIRGALLQHPPALAGCVRRRLHVLRPTVAARF